MILRTKNGELYFLQNNVEFIGVPSVEVYRELKKTIPASEFDSMPSMWSVQWETQHTENKFNQNLRSTVGGWYKGVYRPNVPIGVIKFKHRVSNRFKLMSVQDVDKFICEPNFKGTVNKKTLLRRYKEVSSKELDSLLQAKSFVLDVLQNCFPNLTFIRSLPCLTIWRFEYFNDKDSDFIVRPKTEFQHSFILGFNTDIEDMQHGGFLFTRNTRGWTISGVTLDIDKYDLFITRYEYKHIDPTSNFMTVLNSLIGFHLNQTPRFFSGCFLI